MRENTTISITAIYQNHDAWLSSLPDVTDLSDWQEVYGRDVAGLAVFNNRSESVLTSSYTGQVTIYRAGVF